MLLRPNRNYSLYTHSNAPVNEQTEAAYASWSQPLKAAVVLKRVTGWLLKELLPHWEMWAEELLLPHWHLLCGCFPSVKMKSDEFRKFHSGFPPLQIHFVLRAETYWFCAWKKKKSWIQFKYKLIFSLQWWLLSSPILMSSFRASEKMTKLTISKCSKITSF